MIRIRPPKFFDYKECLWFLNRNYDDCLIKIKDDVIYKTVVFERKPVLLRIFPSEKDLSVEILAGETSELQTDKIRNFIIDWFDLKSDLKPFYQALEQNKKLSYMSTEFNGLRLIGIPDLFEAICWSIIGQQINLTFAYTLKRRLVETYGEKVEWEKETHYCFPDFQTLAKLNLEDLRSMQFSYKKGEYLIGIANAFANGEIGKERLLSFGSLEEKQKALTNFKGIGIWTANYVLMKSLREPSCIPYGDVGLFNALENHKIIHDRKESEKINRLFQKFKGWESYLVFYLWRSLTQRPKEKA